MNARWHAADAKALILAVAPELRSVPLYVLCQSRLPRASGGDSGAAGFTSGVLDALARPYLEARGLWRGRGVAVVINDGWIRAANMSDTMRWVTFRSVVLHEVCHRLEAAQLWDEPPEDVTTTQRDHARYLRLVGELDATAADELMKDTHGAEFVRLAVHLVHRARATNTGGVYPDMVGGVSEDEYGRLAAALGDEPKRMAGATFQAIKAEPIPAAFRRVFDEDSDRE